MSAVFITGTGTDVGKTFVTAGLVRCLQGLRQPVSVLKPVVSVERYPRMEDRSAFERRGER